MGTIKAAAALFLSLIPGQSREQREARLPQVESVQTEASVKIKAGTGPEDTAAQAAAKAAVYSVVQEYSQNAPAHRLDIYEKTIMPDYAAYVKESKILESRKDKEHWRVRAETQVLAKPLKNKMRSAGLRAVGERMEFQVMITPLSGGTDGTDAAAGGATVTENSYSGTLVGFGIRYHWLDRFFTEGGGLMLAKDVKIGDYAPAAGAGSKIIMTHYFPFWFTAGWQYYNRAGLRLSHSIGYSWTIIRGELRPTVANRTFEKQTIGSFIFGTEAQYAFSRWLGVGFRADYRPKTRYDAISGKAVSNWLLGSQILVSF